MENWFIEKRNILMQFPDTPENKVEIDEVGVGVGGGAGQGQPFNLWNPVQNENY